MFYYYHYHHCYHYPYHHFIINILCYAPSVFTCFVGGVMTLHLQTERNVHQTVADLQTLG